MEPCTVVMKFGGASLKTPEHFTKVADIILQKSRESFQIVVVVSAMGSMTDELLALANQVHPNPPRREQDVLVSVGERISIALLAMALELKGKKAISLTGRQSGIITDSNYSEAKIISVKPSKVIRYLNTGNIVVVAGFQGINRKGEITTLGRGGSDISAVALGIALNAQKVEFYKDVEGFYSDDPKLNQQATFFPHLNYEKAIAIVERGAKILHPQSLILASKRRLPLHILPFHAPDHGGTLIHAC